MLFAVSSPVDDGGTAPAGGGGVAAAVERRRCHRRCCCSTSLVAAAVLPETLPVEGTVSLRRGRESRGEIQSEAKRLAESFERIDHQPHQRENDAADKLLPASNNCSCCYCRYPERSCGTSAVMRDLATLMLA